MRILNLAGSMLVPGLLALGHSVYRVGLDRDADFCVQRPYTVKALLKHVLSQGFNADVVFYCDNGNLPMLLDPQNLPYPSIVFLIDTYCNPWHIPYSYGFDVLCMAQKDFLKLYEEDSLLTKRWLPLFCQSTMAEKNDQFSLRDVPICFVGNVGHKNNPDRGPFLQAFRKFQPLIVRQGPFDQLFRRSQIVLNQTAFSEVNFRCFEAMACGAALLTEMCGNGLCELFTPDEQILPLYQRGDAYGAACIAKCARENQEHLQAIAQAGQDCVRREHTDVCRSRILEALFGELIQTECWRRRLGEEYAYRNMRVASAFGVLAAECDASQRLFFKMLAEGKLPGAAKILN